MYFQNFPPVLFVFSRRHLLSHFHKIVFFFHSAHHSYEKHCHCAHIYPVRMILVKSEWMYLIGSFQPKSMKCMEKKYLLNEFYYFIFYISNLKMIAAAVTEKWLRDECLMSYVLEWTCSHGAACDFLPHFSHSIHIQSGKCTSCTQTRNWKRFFTAIFPNATILSLVEMS